MLMDFQTLWSPHWSGWQKHRPVRAVTFSLYQRCLIFTTGKCSLNPLNKQQQLKYWLTVDCIFGIASSQHWWQYFIYICMGSTAHHTLCTVAAASPSLSVHSWGWIAPPVLVSERWRQRSRVRAGRWMEDWRCWYCCRGGRWNPECPVVRQVAETSDAIVPGGVCSVRLCSAGRALCTAASLC